MAGSASGEALFEVRALAAQIGWVETCIPISAANAVANIELFLSSGLSERAHTSSVAGIRGLEFGLVATWGDTR